MKKRRVLKGEYALIAADVQNMKIKCTTDRYVFQHIDLTTSVRFATIDITATFISKVDYTVNLFYEKTTTAELKTLTQLCEFEPPQRVTILSLAQTNPYVAGFLLKGNRDKFVLKEGSSLWFYECEHDLSPLHTHKENFFYKSSIIIHYTM